MLLNKMEHYYSEKQTSPLNLKKIKAVLRGKSFELYTGSGVFSGKTVDKGTEIMVNHVIVNTEDKVLDLGCGYGVVGIALKKTFPKIELFMADINKRAIHLTKKNAKLNKIEAEIKQGNLYEPFDSEKFDTIISNPPQTAGKDVCIEIIEKAPKHLKKGGRLQIVARHNKGGKQLSEIMQEVFGNLDILARKSGYRVYSSTKS
jgi:16S rRNA (guanine1207-N2)-methyltransferase